MHHLLELPTELLLNVLQELSFEDLLHCKRICKLFGDIISNNTRLQYRIKLAINGMVDNPACTLSIAERSKRLSAYEDSWKSLNPKELYEVDLGGNGVWEFSRGVLAQARGARTLSFVQLRSSIQQTGEKRWEILDVGYDIDDFGMDPDQNLLVVGESRSTLYALHLLTLTGDKHPLACNTARLNWFSQHVTGPMQKPKIRIAGDYIGMGFDPFMSRFPSDLVIWNWKTGQLHLALHGFFLSVYSFLTLDRILVLEMDGSFDLRPTGLRVLSFSPPSGSLQLADEVDYEYCFCLPELWDLDGSPLEYIDVRTEPSPLPSSGVNPAAPFYVDTNKRMILLTFFTFSISEDELQNLTLMISVERLMENMKSTRTRRNRRIPWEDWGPSACSIFPDMEGFNDTWVCNVHGTRLINRTYTESGLYVLDCNQLACKQVKSLSDGAGPWKLREQSDVTEAETMHWYKHPVGANLPVLQHKPFPLGPLNRCEAAMLNEDSIIIITDSQRPTTQYYVMDL